MGFANENQQSAIIVANNDLAKHPGAKVIGEGNKPDTSIIQVLSPLPHKDVRELTTEDCQPQLLPWNPRQVDRNGNPFRVFVLGRFKSVDRNGATTWNMSCVFIKQVNVPDQDQVEDPDNPGKVITKAVTVPKLVANLVPDNEALARQGDPTGAAPTPGTTPAAPPQG
jgi:hypothetical protein